MFCRCLIWICIAPVANDKDVESEGYLVSICKNCSMLSFPVVPGVKQDLIKKSSKTAKGKMDSPLFPVVGGYWKPKTCLPCCQRRIDRFSVLKPDGNHARYCFVRRKWGPEGSKRRQRNWLLGFDGCRSPIKTCTLMLHYPQKRIVWVYLCLFLAIVEWWILSHLTPSTLHGAKSQVKSLTRRRIEVMMRWIELDTTIQTVVNSYCSRTATMFMFMYNYIHTHNIISNISMVYVFLYIQNWILSEFLKLRNLSCFSGGQAWKWRRWYSDSGSWQCQVWVIPLQGMKSLPTTENKNVNFMDVLLFLNWICIWR